MRQGKGNRLRTRPGVFHLVGGLYADQLTVGDLHDLFSRSVTKP